MTGGHNTLTMFGSYAGMTDSAVDTETVRVTSLHLAVHQAAVETVAAMLDASKMLVESPRWVIGQEDPAVLVPGDVPILRYMAMSSAMSTLLAVTANPGQPLNSTEQYLVALAHTVMHSQAYFISDKVCDLLLDADAPHEQLLERIVMRAPATSIWFGKELDLPHYDTDNSEELNRVFQESRERLQNSFSLKAKLYGGMENIISLEERCTNHHGRLAGLVLFSNPDGSLSDQVLWIVSADPIAEALPPFDKDRVRGTIPGELSRSLLAPLALVVAATVSWGSWTSPPLPPRIDGLSGRARRRALQGRAGRRAIEAGALADVRVLNVKKTAPTVSGAAEQDAANILNGLSPAPHWRRPHIRRVRVGPKESWHFETRQIRRVLVMPHGPVRSGDLIWRIPAPKPPAN